MNKLIYIADPMCSWCYGFSPEIRKVKEHFSAYGFQLVIGGLRPYHTERIVDMQDFLREHWEQVAQRSGQPFNFNILADPSFIYDTEPASRATVVIRQLEPDLEFDFFSAVQQAFYYDNLDMGDIGTYVKVIDKLNIPVTKDKFAKLFQADELKTKTRADFEYSASLGVRGFPSLILQRAEQHYLIARGYDTSQNIIKRILSSLGSSMET